MKENRGFKQAVPVEEIIDRCLASSDVCDQRKGGDLRHLAMQVQDRWRGRFAIKGFNASGDLSLTMLCRLQVAGLVSRDRCICPHEQFRFALSIPHRYPLSLPGVRFVGEMPFCPHVVHRSFMPQMTGIPPELQEYLRLGEGYCCYLRSSQWSVDLSCNLALVVWQVSRLLTFDKLFGEMGSLNPSARDYALRLRDQGKTPLGRSLPYPAERPSAAGRESAGGASVMDADESCDAIEWVDHGTIRT